MCSGVELGTEAVLLAAGLPRELADEDNEVVLELLDRQQFPLLGSSSNGNAMLVRDLLNSGAAVNAATRLGTTALWLASAEGHTRVVKELLKHGADCTVRSTFGGASHTPMDMALAMGNADVALHLAKVGTWQSDASVRVAVAKLVSRSRSLPAEVRRAMEGARCLRDQLRALVDPRAKARRNMIFRGSPLLRLPWHLRVQVLEFVVLGPIRDGWGREEFSR